MFALIIDLMNHRESERNYVLDEDDYELLQESNISVPRPKLVSSFFVILVVSFHLCLSVLFIDVSMLFF